MKLLMKLENVQKKIMLRYHLDILKKKKDKLFSSQITIDKNGEIISNFKRVSMGWKEANSNKQYCEGKEFPKFNLLGKSFSIGLCGDFWYEENCKAVKKLNVDFVL